MNAREHRRGVLLMVGATSCWATAGILVRNMRLTDGWELTFWRSLFMTLFVLGILLVQYRARRGSGSTRSGRPGMLVGALWALMYICFILALGRTTVANVLVLSSFSPFASALMGRLFLHERVPGRIWLAMAAAVVGIVLMFMEAINTGGLGGNLIALVIPLAFACNIVILRKSTGARRYDSDARVVGCLLDGRNPAAGAAVAGHVARPRACLLSWASCSSVWVVC